MGEPQTLAFDLEHASIDRCGEALAVAGRPLDERCRRLRRSRGEQRGQLCLLRAERPACGEAAR